jgi:3D (Asp-Asp-Asp) domain-containing protein
MTGMAVFALSGSLVPLLAGLPLQILLGGFQAPESPCQTVLTTAYAVEQFPGTTTDGTRTPGNAGAIAAGGHAYPLGSSVWVEGLGVRRIADRGYLGWWQIDVLVDTVREALQFGRQERQVCPEPGPR